MRDRSHNRLLGNGMRKARNEGSIIVFQHILLLFGKTIFFNFGGRGDLFFKTG